MNFFELTSWIGKKISRGVPKLLNTKDRQHLIYVIFLVLICLFYIVPRAIGFSQQKLKDNTIVMEQYGERLKISTGSALQDSAVVEKEREQLLTAIEERIVSFLYQIPDYSYIKPLETYLEYRPKLLEQFPSAVPLEKGGYYLSSRYGIRIHPISGRTKKHFGLDLAAKSGEPVYASAAGIVSKVIYSKKGYGTHIIIRHRFGFGSLYGHLSIVLVHEGQKVAQHDLIGTVGSSGSSTGYHLHYEVMKNDVKIDPRPSLNLKKDIYGHLIKLKLDTVVEQ